MLSVHSTITLARPHVASPEDAERLAAAIKPLLFGMLFPDGVQDRLNPLHLGVTTVLKAFIERECTLQRTGTVGGHEFPEHRAGPARDTVIAALFQGLKAGALLYALHWTAERQRDTKNATMRYAAHLVDKQAGRNRTAFLKTLKAFDPYAPVSHYWAALLCVIQPSGFRGVSPLNPDEGLDPLIDFIARIDLSKFASYAYLLRQFAEGFVHPRGQQRTTVLPKGQSFKTLLPLDLEQNSVESTHIPCIWADDFSFDEIKEKHGREAALQRKYEWKAKNVST